MKRTLTILCALGLCLSLHAGKWTTHFAYNNVTQIAASPDRVYALSDGSLFSVDKQTEQITVYNRQTGLHSTGISCIHYDQLGQQLIIAYSTGKIDILSARGVRYIGDLYDKDMTQRKTIYNVTISGRTAYLATHYGIQTMDLREYKLVDSYWLRPAGQETPIKDVLLQSDSIYAFSDDSLYSAALSDPLSDYHYWHREAAGRIAPDEEKGIHYQDATDHWFRGYSEGIIRFTPTERLTYKPEGPLQNNPYRMSARQGMLYVVPGGRWSSQYNTPGCLMRYDGQEWHNLSAEAISAQGDVQPTDFMNVAIDSTNPKHCYVSSYGTGLYEFTNDSLTRHYIAGQADNTLVAIAPTDPGRYTRLDFAKYDQEKRLWMLDACTHSQLQCLDPDGTWHALNLTAEMTNVELHTPAGFVIDRRNPQRKWIATARFNTCVFLMDDQGTPFDTSDDQTMVRSEWIDQHGNTYRPEFIFDLMQDPTGRIWIATDQGVAYIDTTTDFFQSDAITIVDLQDEQGEQPLASQRVQSLCAGPDNSIWVGTQLLGIYVLSSDASAIIAHYTTDNTAMPSNSILSLAYDAQIDRMYVGTGDGLVEYDPSGTGEGLSNTGQEAADEETEGNMLQWKLHFSYSDPQEIAATPHAIYAAANGSLFSVDREDEHIDYWNKSTGLHGSSVTHIAYDKKTDQLIIAYENGQIDLMNSKGQVTQMPDVSLKAGTIDVTINDICTGSRYAYLAMPFGIIAINPKKAEISETYYIGTNAAAIAVQHVIEWQDTLYAFSFDKLYKASLRDNLVDYTYWKSESLPCEMVAKAVVCYDRLYTLQHDSIYRYVNGTWQLVRPEPFAWITANEDKLLAYHAQNGLYALDEADQLSGISNLYRLNNATYSNGEYWLAESSYGLIRLGTGGDDYFHTDGPNSNFGYCMYAAHDQIYSAIGGRWAEQFQRYGRINIYNRNNWRCINEGNIGASVGRPAIDIVSLSIDPNDAGHWFAATYGTGVFEFKDYQAISQYDGNNSTLRRVNNSVSDAYYTRTDGAMMDAQGNFWVLNATSIGSPLHIRNTYGQWKAINLSSYGEAIEFTTPGGQILIDQRNENRKWMYDQRHTPGVILLDDGGTPFNTSDDRCRKRNQWTDQNGNVLSPSQIMCIAQDMKNRMWIGTGTGILIIPAEVDFMNSNACHRIIIPRNDGTGLGDYLLGSEQVNCMVIDGGNRMWIGTENSGIYLIEDDTITVAHFTTDNSLLPSNTIQSMAIMPTTGELFIGTAKGIASYRSDASAPQEDLTNAYAFPNPVRPNYQGVITIAGLMENTAVNIIDESGNLVCKTRSYGGTAVWDGRIQNGRRATSGVYTALCNEPTGKHTVVKILVIR